MDIKDNSVTSCSGTRQLAIFPFLFSSRCTESDLYRGFDWGDLYVDKFVVSTLEEEDPIVDLQIDGRPVLPCLQIAAGPMTKRVDEKGTWFVKTWVPRDAGSMVMRSHAKIRSRDLTASYPKETWAYAALIGTHSVFTRCVQQYPLALNLPFTRRDR